VTIIISSTTWDCL